MRREFQSGIKDPELHPDLVASVGVATSVQRGGETKCAIAPPVSFSYLRVREEVVLSIRSGY